MDRNGSRPDPDALLADLKAASNKPRRGKLKIFLGMCAGVGKTYAMMRAARALKNAGKDLLVGIAETHGRPETAALLEDMPVLPLRDMAYKGTVIRELDLDEILKLRPALAIIDELAHTNAPGSRHRKRYQDVLEILDAGIDVFTTLNIQHIESRVDVVREFTGVTVRETVPDSILDDADEIQLVDLTPEQLRERLSEGKVYMGETAATAAENFFRPENLTALREIALRVTAEHVGRDLRETLDSKQIAGAWRSGEHLLVAVGPSPFSEKLVRYTRRMASSMDVPWTAVYVESAAPISEDGKKQLARNLSLARQLGAQIAWTAGDDLARSLLDAAREHHATQIVVGKPLGSAWDRWRRGATLRRLLRDSGSVDICVVTADRNDHPAMLNVSTPAAAIDFRGYALGGGAVIVATAAFSIVRDWTGYWTVALLYLALVVFLALRFSRGPTLMIAALSALCWNFFFIPPLYTFYIAKFEDALMFGMYFLVAVVMGETTARLKWREQALRRGEQRSRALYRLAQSMIEIRGMEESLAAIVQELRKLFDADVAIFTADENDALGTKPRASHGWSEDAKESGVVQWVFIHRQAAGQFTETLPNASGIYIPLATSTESLGVLGLRFETKTMMSLEERGLLDAIADLVAVLIQRDALIRQSGRTRLAEESERLYRTIFSSVSHELKTPLAVIASAAAELEPKLGAAAALKALSAEMQGSARRLRRVVDNLLNISRIEAGRLSLKPEWHDVDELVEEARDQVDDLVQFHRVRLEIASDVPSVRLDAAFVECALANLMANAAQYSPAGGEIRVSARIAGSRLEFRVADRGPGIAPEEAPRVFEKFFRGSNARPDSTGLGLSIVKGLADAMGGAVSVVSPGPQGGAEFRFSIPVETAKIADEES